MPAVLCTVSVDSYVIPTEPLEHTCYHSCSTYVVLSECTLPSSHPGTLLPTAVGSPDGTSRGGLRPESIPFLSPMD